MSTATEVASSPAISRPLTVDSIRTVQLAEYPNIIWVQIGTDEGLVGLGETFLGSDAVAAYLHESVAPYLLGEDARAIVRHTERLKGYIGYGAAGVETRGNSAINIALWDLLGRATSTPLYQLLGGASRNSIRIYNTCAGPRYIRTKPTQSVDNWGLSAPDNAGRYEDLQGFLLRPAELAEELLDEGIEGMKIWPLDPYAEASGGRYISSSDLRDAIRPFEKIRAAVGDRMDLMVEMHALWDLPTAQRICRALEEFKPVWYEDPIRSSDIMALRRLADSVETPIAVSETLAGREAFRDLMDAAAVGAALIDVSWCGGIDETKHIANMAAARQLPIALHDCTGPVVLGTSVHLSMHLSNALIQETVRAYYRGWYAELVSGLPRIEDGYVYVSDAPGHGIELNDETVRRPDAKVLTSSASGQ